MFVPHAVTPPVQAHQFIGTIVQIGMPTVSPGREPREVWRQVRLVVDTFGHCFEIAIPLAQRPQRVSFELHFQLDRAGRTRGVHLDHSTLPSRPLDLCVASIFTRMRFAAAPTAMQRVTVPVTFISGPH